MTGGKRQRVPKDRHRETSVSNRFDICHARGVSVHPIVVGHIPQGYIDPMTSPTTGPPTRRPRVLYSLASAAALVVTVVFSTVGDGVDVPDAAGLRRVIVDGGHIGVWALLTVAFAIAAVRGRWGRVSNGIALAAGALYAVFLIAVFVWR
jgi:hypothetical protein